MPKNNLDSKIVACDNCGTMLDVREDPMMRVMGSLPESTNFVLLQFCCQKCANEFAKAHTDDGTIGGIPVMMLSSDHEVEDMRSHAVMSICPGTVECADDDDYEPWSEEKYKKYDEESGYEDSWYTEYTEDDCSWEEDEDDREEEW